MIDDKQNSEMKLSMPAELKEATRMKMTEFVKLNSSINLLNHLLHYTSIFLLILIILIISEIYSSPNMH